MLTNLAQLLRLGVVGCDDAVKKAFVILEIVIEVSGTFNDFMRYFQTFEILEHQGRRFDGKNDCSHGISYVAAPGHTLVIFVAGVNPSDAQSICYNRIMLHVFYGNDTLAVRDAALTFVADAALTTRIERIDCSTVSPHIIADMAGSMSLFGEATTYVLDTPRDYGDWYEALGDAAAALIASTNTIVIIEGAFLVADKKLFSGAELHESTKSATERQLDVFALANQLLTKDKKSLWLTLVSLRQQGVSAEELIGILWWQLKSLRLATITASAAEADMKPFPYDKAKRALRLFTKEDIERLSTTLLAVYHDGHGGVRDIETGLEEWVLQL